MRRRSTSKHLLKQMNSHLVLELIQQRGPMSRIALARQTGLAPSTITSLTRRLIEAGVVVEGAKDPTSPRRKAILLHSNPDACFALAVDLGKYQSTLALLNLAGEVIRQTSLPMDGVSQATLVDHLVHGLSKFVDPAEASWQKVCGVGIGVPGVVDPTEHTVRSPVAFGWTPYVALDTQLERAWGVPVLVENDTNAAAVAEQLYGAAMGLNGDLVYVTIGEGIGAGIIINGKVYRGAQHGAGEFGHTSVDADGPECRCGSRGCVENYASVPAIVEAFCRSLSRNGLARVFERPHAVFPRRHHVDPQQRKRQLAAIVQSARDGDSIALGVLASAATRLGQALVNLINLFDPQLIVLGGSACVMDEYLMTPVRRIVGQRTGIVAFDPERIVLSQLGEDGEIKGLAALVAEMGFSLGGPLAGIVRNRRPGRV